MRYEDVIYPLEKCESRSQLLLWGIDRLYGGREDRHTGESGSNGCSLAPPESASHGEVSSRLDSRAIGIKYQALEKRATSQAESASVGGRIQGRNVKLVKDGRFGPGDQ